ncbi:cell growth-regulating nucleolar protein [Nasonia vitripennis]|uniref:Cell growth-regulating nucleolar protein n=1 Tax=Nasonia vitripennis TaxID=7425 RepID=A0A7M7G4F9_NASVI|nr:cell growth-regulating nucleolar protein [Nasonia vitripennis]XP_003427667.1 cell growth-regulating nucleolar protein [Nasonia vitripennis]XP_032455112.1 cell growth-regulating nucleolar protein [Nasonia vitripennis]XP_032455113.1 cell growth-regulating nucleolar protein [Nasonia vitripennis]
MVVFTCNNCGDSLQKPKVAKHYQFACRNPVFVTCVDCFKDFRGDEYVAHTKCITENQRYGGKDYVQKPSANKGELKQQAWLNVVQNVLANSTNLTVPERNLLNSISRHENIPRKKAKFFNFIKSMSGNKANMTIVDSVWEKMEKAFKEVTAGNNANTENNEKQNVSTEENQNNSNIIRENDTVDDKNDTNEGENKDSCKKKKKSKKRQHEDDKNENGEPAAKKQNDTNVTDAVEEETNAENGVSKFSWKNTILEIVTTKGEVSLKKLRKKVVAQYLASFPNGTTEKATSKFEKKLGKVSDIVINEDKVTLASS